MSYHLTNEELAQDVTDYPWNWRRISYRVKRLHGFRCERCGHPHVPSADNLSGIRDLWERDWKRSEDGILVIYRHEPADVTDLWSEHGHTDCSFRCRHRHDGKQRTLTSHHLDGHKPNCRIWNLAALCQLCHLQVQAKVCWDQTYLLDHKPWMMWHIERYRRLCEKHGIKSIH